MKTQQEPRFRININTFIKQCRRVVFLSSAKLWLTAQVSSVFFHVNLPELFWCVRETQYQEYWTNHETAVQGNPLSYNEEKSFRKAFKPIL